MTASELHRKLIYCGYTDLSDYLNESPANRYIYNKVIDLLSQHQINVPIVTLFNEVYYQCVRIQCDGNPGEDVSKRYLAEEERWLNSRQAAELVFCLMWVLVKRKKQLSFNEDCFISRLTPLLSKSGFMHLAEEFLHYTESEKIYSLGMFKPMTCPVKEIPMRIDNEHPGWLHISKPSVVHNPWREITDGFSQNTIKWYVDLYTKREDRIALLMRIAKACNSEEYKRLDDFFLRQKKEINAGNFISSNMKMFQVYGNSMYPADIHEGYILVTKKDEEQTLEYKTRKIAELKDEKAALEERYQSEIEKLKKQLEQQQSQPSDDSKEMSFSVSEMVAQVKECFDEMAAYQFCNMIYTLVINHGNIDKEALALLASVIPDIKQRDYIRQTLNFYQTDQVNVHSEVENKYMAEEPNQWNPKHKLKPEN